MPYITNWEENGICWHHSGVVTSQEIFDFNNEFYQNPKSDYIHYQIINRLNVERFELNSSTMKKIAALDYAASLSIPNIKVAVVEKKSHSKIIKQEYTENLKNFHSSWVVKSFEDMSSARKWVSSDIQ